MPTSKCAQPHWSTPTRVKTEEHISAIIFVLMMEQQNFVIEQVGDPNLTVSTADFFFLNEFYWQSRKKLQDYDLIARKKKPTDSIDNPTDKPYYTYFIGDHLAVAGDFSLSGVVAYDGISRRNHAQHRCSTATFFKNVRVVLQCRGEQFSELVSKCKWLWKWWN
mgnify:CR=1 FL=1